MKLTDLKPRDTIYRGFAARYIPGRVHIKECPLCGFLVWSSTSTKEPDGFDVAVLDRECERCDSVLQRSPEVYQWTLSVVAKMLRDTQPEKLDNSEHKPL